MQLKPVPARHPANPFEAFRQLVYTFGVPELALQMGLKPGTLYNKADADEETHHQPTLRDVLLATRLTKDMRVLDSLDEQFGRSAYDMTRHGLVSDEALLELLAKLGAEAGEFHGALHAALIDKAFTPMEMVQIRAEAFDMVSALMTLVVRLEGLIDG